MRYMLQVNTGSLTRTADAGTVVERLGRSLDRLDVSGVIYGWSPDRAVNEAVSSLLLRRNVAQYLWLPVFCEIHGEGAAPFVGVGGMRARAIDDLCAGESFDFVCQSAPENRDRAAEFLESQAATLPLDGVFIDRIRYASAANSRDDLFGCWCERCAHRYTEAGVDADRIRAMALGYCLAEFIPERLEGCAYRYRDADIDRVMAVRRDIITEAMQALCARFRRMGLAIGIDTFAPAVADFVGQDLMALGGLSDFIKPMIYLRTTAPAGVPYEADALGGEIEARLNELWGADIRGVEGAVIQARRLMDAGLNVAPGIDCNRIEGVCGADAEYATGYLDALEAAGCGEAVLSWDVTRIGDDVIDAIARRGR